MKKLSLLIPWFLVAAGPALAEVPDQQPVKRELQLIHVFEGQEPEFLLAIGQSGFKTVAALKEHLRSWAPGSELRWAPGCLRFGKEPLLSSERDMQAFRKFLEERKIKFVLVPSG